MIRLYDITPTPAPRQTRKDAWEPSPGVQRYRAFRDEVGYKIKDLPPEFFHAIFLLPMPRSWSRKKRDLFFGHPHKSGGQPDGSWVKEQKPDKDNLEKALVDAVYRGRDDSHVWNGASTKLWAHRGAILISTQFIHIVELPVDLEELAQGCPGVYDQSPIV